MQLLHRLKQDKLMRTAGHFRHPAGPPALASLVLRHNRSTSSGGARSSIPFIDLIPRSKDSIHQTLVRLRATPHPAQPAGTRTLDLAAPEDCTMLSAAPVAISESGGTEGGDNAPATFNHCSNPSLRQWILLLGFTTRIFLSCRSNRHFTADLDRKRLTSWYLSMQERRNTNALSAISKTLETCENSMS